MSDVGDVLRRAAELIEPEGAWCQGAFARTADGRSVGPGAPAAVCWCASGAIGLSSTGQHATREALVALVRETGHLWIGDWNDAPERTQAEVVAALRAAAERVG